ncbi:MAG TPA: C39 family peptidase [Candidatus Acutalibacter pullistercoris]|uniref:C39 family peptidase n=1 Tax=Candidatus Acutalibacter pullistercoris TaxID=2838418 RepID=A0A9D1YC60_9FIRM|nr:C39 family peptidase [Candidatus Acutalibacter pullistercoris]
MVLAAAACCALGAAALVLLLPTVTAQRLIQDGGNPTLTAVSSRQALDAPYLSQEDYPTGCESVSAVMALQYWGVDLTVEEFIDGYLPLGDAPHTDSAGHFVGCDPRKAFPGDPRKETGWGCYSPVIEKALVQVLSDQQRHDLAVARVDGASLEELYDKYVSQGTPVLLWVTIGMETPRVSALFTLEDSGETFAWLYPLHCVLWVGMEGDGFLFHDPLAGPTARYAAQEVSAAYDGLGRQAVVVAATGGD